MLCKTRGIVLHSIPYNDKYAIIHIYTESFGRVSYLVSRHRRRRTLVAQALFMPLSVLEMEVEHLNTRDLQRIRETKICYRLHRIPSHPVKNVIALFLAEVLYRVVRDPEPDARLFNYLYESI
ncbi:MAG: DNA repair protein RecO, partial [Dysgonamonadaceae bacterium]|nr:DNA repair protein RecO [Dysgonamonadaceae bacterium]